MTGDRNGEAFVDVDVLNINEAASQEFDEGVGVVGCADSDGIPAQLLEPEPSLAHEGRGVPARLRVEPVEDL